jgi:two-component system, chemotaxis family, CheB/CheR fusion protein
LLARLPVDTGMAFVLVMHLDPAHESILTELLAKATRMPVSEVQDGVAVAPDHVYVMPRNTSMAIEGGALRLRPRQEGRGQHRPIDSFLQSLAEDRNARAVGVILSGTATDGTLGLEAIKAEDGITFAQDPQSAKFDSMPRSAIAAGCVDFILSPEEIAKELARISLHPYVVPAATAKPDAEETPHPAGKNGFNKILTLLRRTTGVDFSLYKTNTLHRRIRRRMILNKLDGLDEYAHYLRENAAEVEHLYQDILINVTNFFRNPESFEVLKEKIFPRLIEQRTTDEPLRIWVMGCSTGEEAYSIAMAFTEFIGERSGHIPVQIFATDINEKSIERARAGLYSKNITADVSPEHLRRFFMEADGGYRVSKPLRDMCVFARQNIAADPPFSRMDLISCRNLLIYLESALQKQILSLLHYALKPTGILWLGSSETTGAAPDLFEPEDKRHRFYARKPATNLPRLSYVTGAEARKKDSAPSADELVGPTATSGGKEAQREADRIILARYAPASALINEELNVLQLRGDTTPYFEQSHGEELNNRNTELGRLNSDLANLLGSVQIPILMLDSQFRIRRFTPAAEKLLNLIQTDVGRPIGDLKLNLDFHGLESLIAEAVDTVSVKEVEARDGDGRWYSLRVRPYKTLDNKIDGAVVALVDIDALKQTEREIREKRDYAEAILRTARAPLIVLSADLRVDTANDEFYKTFSVSPDVTEGRLIYDLGNRQWDIPGLRQLLEEIIPRNSVFNDYEVTHEFQTIGKRTMLLNARRLDNPEGGPERILLGIDDVTERMEARAAMLAAEALRESEERFRTLADNAPALIWVTSQTGCEFVNREYLEFLGVGEAEVLGENWAKFVHPEDREDYVNAYLKAVSSRTRFEGEFRFRRRDGEYRWMHSVGMPRFEGSEFKGYVGSTFDIHDRKLAETAMAQMAAIVESSEDAIISKDLNGIIASWNKGAEKLFGYTAAEVIGKPLMILVPPGRADEETFILERIRRGEEVDPYETVRRRKDGSEIDISLTVSPIRDKSGKVIGASKIARDITERKRLEIEREELLRRESAARAEAEKVSRLKDEFLATVSHELRSPLNSILGWARMLSENRLDQKKSARAFEVIYRNAHAQNQLIGDLLEVSRIITGKLRLDVRMVELIPIIEAAMDVVRPAADAKQIKLVSSLDPAAWPVSGDADRLQQIVWNLLSNAVKFTPRGGQVAVSLEREGASVTIIVSDTGEGIEPEFLPFVFDRFRQFEGDTKRAHGGLGLGLAIVRHLVELHGGTVGAASTGKGRGATFTVTLPLTAPREETSEIGRGRPAGAGEIPRGSVLSPDYLRDLRVLLVDDEPDARDLLSEMLTNYGAEVKTCASAAEALQTLDEWRPDALVSDIGMPGEDGYELLGKIRAREPERGGRIPAVALTAYARAEDARRALRVGYQMHIPKPVESDLLAAAVASLAGGGRED